MSLITVSSLSKSFGAEDIFGGVTFTIARGARLALVGPNGIGKTTLLRILVGPEEPSTGQVTRALGMQEQVAVDIQSDDAQAGDCYVLCSDGLSGMIDDAEILQVISATTDLETACRRLVVMANEHGGEDNITALVVRIEAAAEGEISLSDTLPTPAVRQRDASVPDGQADTPPAASVSESPSGAKTG
jgi:ATPase subunit of ABC transporter with duplicated ATPase domains